MAASASTPAPKREEGFNATQALWRLSMQELNLLVSGYCARANTLLGINDDKDGVQGLREFVRMIADNIHINLQVALIEGEEQIFEMYTLDTAAKLIGIYKLYSNVYYCYAAF